MKTSGRGNFLMRSFMDEVEWVEPARRRNDSANGEESLIFDFVLLIAHECGNLSVTVESKVRNQKSKIFRETLESWQSLTSANDKPAT